MNRTERIEQIMDEILQDALPGYTIDKLPDEKKVLIYKMAAERYQTEEAIENLKAARDALYERSRPLKDRILDRISKFIEDKTHRYTRWIVNRGGFIPWYAMPVHSLLYDSKYANRDVMGWGESLAKGFAAGINKAAAAETIRQQHYGRSTHTVIIEEHAADKEA